MVSAVKEICIFMIIAQALLMFVPGSVYMKYVKVLVGLLMILMIVSSVADFFGEDVKSSVYKKIEEFEEEMPKEYSFGESEESNVGIYESVEEELKNRLNQDMKEESYCVKAVALKRIEGKEQEESTIEGIVITVEELKEEAENIYIAPVKAGKAEALEEEKREELRQKYGECIGVDPERIIIREKYG